MTIWGDINRRSQGNQLRKEDKFSCDRASSVPALDVKTDELLSKVDGFMGYLPFIPGEIHSNLKVVLKDTETEYVTVSLKHLKDELSRLEDDLKKLEKAEADQEELGEIRRRISILKDIIDSCSKAGKTEYTFEVEILGKYVRENDGTPQGQPTIYLLCCIPNKLNTFC